MARQCHVPGMRATKPATLLCLAVARYGGDVEVRASKHTAAVELVHRFGFLLETYRASGGEVPADKPVPPARRELNRRYARVAPPATPVPVRLRVRPSVDPAWAVALAQHVESGA